MGLGVVLEDGAGGCDGAWESRMAVRLGVGG